jgi:hypothetical protein
MKLLFYREVRILQKRRSSMKKYKLFMILLLILIIAYPVSASAPEGIWIRDKVRYSFLTPDQESIFNRATEKQAGIEFTPVALLAERNIGGMEYVYLCKAAAVVQPSKKYWFVLTAYKSMNDRVTLRCTRRIRLRSIATNKDPRRGTSEDGFRIIPVMYEPAALSDSAGEVFIKGTENYAGYNLRPIALLGTQEVNGKNYKFLCYGTGVGTNRSSRDIFVLDIYEHPSGLCTLKSCEPMNLRMYVY